MKLNIFVSIALVVLLTACGGESKKVQEKVEDTIVNAENQASKNKSTGSKVESKTKGFTTSTFNKEMVKALPYDGELLYGRSWEDKNGKNILIFTEKTTEKQLYPDEPSTYTINLHAYHFAGDKLIREVKDFEKDCMFDMRARFIEKSITITDIDEDGYAEVTFVYRLGCTSELSPDGLKLMMLENGEKYAIRGNTLVDYSGDGSNVVGGVTNVDDSFNAIPEFLAHAKKIWDEQQIHYKPIK
jgi:hypothetical protein